MKLTYNDSFSSIDNKGAAVTGTATVLLKVREPETISLAKLQLVNFIYAEAELTEISKSKVEAIIEQIWDDLGGSASRSDIRTALMEVAPAYEGVRVKTYVPIFLRRDVTRRLLGRLTL